MLMAHPTVLADLLEQYETLRARHDRQENDTQLLHRLNDVSYTLCVATGTRESLPPSQWPATSSRAPERRAERSEPTCDAGRGGHVSHGPGRGPGDTTGQTGVRRSTWTPYWARTQKEDEAP